jgi:hypothetical protein
VLTRLTGDFGMMRAAAATSGLSPEAICPLVACSARQSPVR